MAQDQITAAELRDKLKEIMSAETENIPELLSELQPKERLNFIIKLMPFVFPKVENVGVSYGEPINWDSN